jgi:hypothetical protein
MSPTAAIVTVAAAGVAAGAAGAAGLASGSGAPAVTVRLPAGEQAERTIKAMLMIAQNALTMQFAPPGTARPRHSTITLARRPPACTTQRKDTPPGSRRTGSLRNKSCRRPLVLPVKAGGRDVTM